MKIPNYSHNITRRIDWTILNFERTNNSSLKTKFTKYTMNDKLRLCWRPGKSCLDGRKKNLSHFSTLFKCLYAGWYILSWFMKLYLYLVMYWISNCLHVRMQVLNFLRVRNFQIIRFFLCFQMIIFKTFLNF